MTPKRITVCEDETFHPQVCLVSIEPVSDFILLEVYCQGRDALSWTTQLTTALEGLPVEVVQVTSDEAKGLLAHAREGLGAHHSPDLFHVQHDLSKATSLPLRAQLSHAQTDLDGARQQTQQWIARRDAETQGPRRPGRPPEFERHIAEGRALEQTMTARVDAAEQRQEQMHQAIRGVGDDYHPFDLASGRPCDADAVRQRLTARFDAIERLAADAALATTARQRIAKARRVLDAMVATLAWVWVVIRTRLDALGLTPPLQSRGDRATDRRPVPGAGGGQGTLPCRTCRDHGGGRPSPGPGPRSGRSPGGSAGRATGSAGARGGLVCRVVPAFQFVRGGT